MATTVSYSASMRTRKANSSSDYKSSAASQEFYTNDYNYVGIRNDIHPHQIDAAVFVCRSHHRDGVIFADDEGLDKTIEPSIPILQSFQSFNGTIAYIR